MSLKLVMEPHSSLALQRFMGNRHIYNNWVDSSYCNYELLSTTNYSPSLNFKKQFILYINKLQVPKLKPTNFTQALLIDSVK